MRSVRIQCSLAGFSIDGSDILSIGTAQMRAIDIAVRLGEPTIISVHDSDPDTYKFAPGAPSFEWMVLGLPSSGNETPACP